MLKSLEKQQAELETELYKVKITINHLKTKVIYVRSPFAQRPVSRFQSPSNRRGNGNEAGTVNTVEASPTSISDDDIVPASETSSDELETSVTPHPSSSRQPLSTFTIKLRPRGCRGKESTERSKAKYDAKKALDQTRVNSSKKEQDVDPHQGTNGFYSIGGEEETAALDVDQNRVNSSEDGEDADQDNQDVEQDDLGANPQDNQDAEQDDLGAHGRESVPDVQPRSAPRLSPEYKAIYDLDQTLKAAQDKAKSQLDNDLPYFKKYVCKECGDSGDDPTCCLLKFKQKKGPTATCCTSEQTLQAVSPTVDEIATQLAQKVVYCDNHGNVVNELCNKHCKQHQRELLSPHVHGAALIAGRSSRNKMMEAKMKAAQPVSDRKNKYAAHKCCGGGETEDIYGHRKEPCCYERFQAGEGKNVEHLLKTNIAVITANIAYPVYVKAKATINACFSPEETAKAILGEYKNAAANFARKLVQENSVIIPNDGNVGEILGFPSLFPPAPLTASAPYQEAFLIEKYKQQQQQQQQLSLIGRGNKPKASNKNLEDHLEDQLPVKTEAILLLRTIYRNIRKNRMKEYRQAIGDLDPDKYPKEVIKWTLLDWKMNRRGRECY